eukprot:EG_transcript_17886
MGGSIPVIAVDVAPKKMFAEDDAPEGSFTNSLRRTAGGDAGVPSGGSSGTAELVGTDANVEPAAELVGDASVEPGFKGFFASLNDEHRYPELNYFFASLKDQHSLQLGFTAQVLKTLGHSQNFFPFKSNFVSLNLPCGLAFAFKYA